MKSAGNDIVALNAIDIKRTILPAFYSKFITPAELELYRQPQFADLPFQNFVWLLWSVKESAYKFLKRHQFDLIFSPSKIIVKGLSDNTPFGLQPHSQYAPSQEGNFGKNNISGNGFYSGEVIIKNQLLHFQAEITGEFIATVVNDTLEFDKIFWGIKQIDSQTTHENQSKEVRAFVLTELEQRLGIKGLQIEKHSLGYPIVLSGANALDILISLAHHDRFVSYSFLTE